MAAAAPSTPSVCNQIETLLLPVNDANTCWWLSANLALFHKERPELNAYFAKVAATAPTAGAQFPHSLGTMFANIYGYYIRGDKDTRTDVEQMRYLLDARSNVDMKIFNTKEFDVAGTGSQSSDEYLSRLSEYLDFNRGLININHGNETGILETDGYDILLHVNHFGASRKDVNSGCNLPKLYMQVGSTVDTLLLTCARGSETEKTNISISPLEIITIPTLRSNFTPADMSNFSANYTKLSSNINFIETPYKGSNIRDYTETTPFYLDAMVVYEPGHYVSYVKCEERWYYYKAIKQGTLTDSNAGNATFSNFEHMMSEHPQIKENFTHLFYSKLIPNPVSP